jgi:ribosomal protein S27E
MKNNCYIYWDDDSVKEQKIYVQCEDCFKKNKRGIIWGKSLLYGKHEIKCDLCNTIIYKKLKKKKGENEATI